MKKIIICATAFALVFGFAFASNSIASDKGPEVMILKTAKAKKPATFPHKKHQDMMECKECHHTMNADGTQGPYVAGQEHKCETCHDGKKIKNKKVSKFMKAAHKKCKGCHKAGYNGKKGPKKCPACHVKKK